MPPYSCGVSTPKKPAALRLVLQLLQLVTGQTGLAQALAAQHLRLQRHHLLAHEGPHPVADLLLLLVEREVHAVLLYLYANALMPVSARPMSSFWIWLVPS